MNRMLDIRDLERGTHILVETTGEVYELTVGTPERCVVLVASDRQIERRDKFVLLGSVDPDTGCLLPHCIAEDWCIRLKPARGPGGCASIITTGLAERVTITVDDVTTELWNTHA